MVVWTKRQNGYQGGVLLFCSGLVVFIVGFATRYWTTLERHGLKEHDGLWESCHSSICFIISPDPDLKEKWFTAVQALQCLALIGFLLAHFYGLYINSRPQSRVFNRYLEFTIGFSAVLGLIGAIVHAAKGAGLKKDFYAYYKSYGSDASINYQPVAWSCIVDIFGCIISIVAAILIAVYNKPLPADIPSTYANVNPAAAPCKS